MAINLQTVYTTKQSQVAHGQMFHILGIGV